MEVHVGGEGGRRCMAHRTRAPTPCSYAAVLPAAATASLRLDNAKLSLVPLAAAARLSARPRLLVIAMAPHVQQLAAAAHPVAAPR